MIYWITVAVLAGVGVALFVIPHHKSDYGSSSLANEIPEFFGSDSSDGPGIFVLMALFLIGSVGVFLPAIQAMALALVSPEASRKVFIIGGVLLVLASVLTFFVEIVTNLSIGWGSGGTPRYPETVVAYLAPLFPFLCGVASIVMGAMRVRMP
jgi:uncharacterized membrane protein YhaH (DUF805 family)